MYNDILSIGPVTIHGYGLMIGLGVVLALITGDKRAQKRGLDGEIIYVMTALAVIFGFLAAKLLFILTKLSDFIANPRAFLAGSGFVVFGGIIGGIITVVIYCRIKKVDPVAYMDLMFPSVALAQGCGRIGCLLAGCCYGRETTSAFSIVFTNSHYAPNGVHLIPTQIIMSVGDFIIAALLFWYSSKKRQRGQVTCIYLMLYSVGRFFVEFLRDDYRGSIGILSTSQFIGLIVLVLAIAAYFLLVPVLNKQTEEAEVAQSAELSESTKDEVDITCAVQSEPEPVKVESTEE